MSALLLMGFCDVLTGTFMLLGVDLVGPGLVFILAGSLMIVAFARGLNLRRRLWHALLWLTATAQAGLGVAGAFAMAKSDSFDPLTVIFLVTWTLASLDLSLFLLPPLLSEPDVLLPLGVGGPVALLLGLWDLCQAWGNDLAPGALTGCGLVLVFWPWLWPRAGLRSLVYSASLANLLLLGLIMVYLPGFSGVMLSLWLVPALQLPWLLRRAERAHDS